MFRFACAVISALTLAACASVPDDVAIGPSSPRGLIVIAVAAPSSGPPLPDFSLTISRFSEEEGRLDGGWARVNNAERDAEGRYWLVAQAEPGLYVISNLSHQSTWHACFNAGTRAFEVEPGQVSFVGAINPLPALQAIALTLPSVSMNGENLFAMDQELAFFDLGGVSSWEAPLERFVRARFPNVTAPITAVANRPVSFNTGRDLFGLQRVCGGYYAPANP
jgi:hypothetical protein